MMGGRCGWYFCDPPNATDAELDGAGRCPLPALPDRAYCPAHNRLAWRQPGEPFDRHEAAPPVAAPAPPVVDAVAPARTKHPARPKPKAQAKADAKPKPPTKAPRPPRSNDALTRADLTMILLHRPEGVTRAELHTAFEAQIGPTGPTTAEQAIQKVPRKRAGRKAERLPRQPGRQGFVFYLPPA